MALQFVHVLTFLKEKQYLEVLTNVALGSYVCRVCGNKEKLGSIMSSMYVEELLVDSLAVHRMIMVGH